MPTLCDLRAAAATPIRHASTASPSQAASQESAFHMRRASAATARAVHPSTLHRGADVLQVIESVRLYRYRFGARLEDRVNNGHEPIIERTPTLRKYFLRQSSFALSAADKPEEQRLLGNRLCPRGERRHLALAERLELARQLDILFQLRDRIAADNHRADRVR